MLQAIDLTIIAADHCFEAAPLCPGQAAAAALAHARLRAADARFEELQPPHFSRRQLPRTLALSDALLLPGLLVGDALGRRRGGDADSRDAGDCDDDLVHLGLLSGTPNGRRTLRFQDYRAFMHALRWEAEGRAADRQLIVCVFALATAGGFHPYLLLAAPAYHHGSLSPRKTARRPKRHRAVPKSRARREIQHPSLTMSLPFHDPQCRA